MNIVLPEVLHSAQRNKIFCGLDNRHDLWRLLDSLSDGVMAEVAFERRRRFLVICAKRLAKDPLAQKCQVSDNGIVTTSDAYWALVGMAVGFGLDLEQAAILLERIVKQKGNPLCKP